MTDKLSHGDSEITGAPATTPPAAKRRVIIPLHLDRRTFIRGGSAAIATAAIGGRAGIDAAADQVDPSDPITQLPHGHYPVVMDRPAEIPSSTSLQSLTSHEAETVDAVTSRILPGDAKDPGAHEAGVVTYIDNLLAFDQGYAEFTYLQGPWAATSASLSSARAAAASPMASPAASPMASPVGSPQATPVASPAGTPGGEASGASNDTFDVVMIDTKDIQRYGYQSRLSPRDVYRIGLAALDRYAQQHHEGLFKDLNAKQQDQIIDKMAKGNIDSFDPQLNAQSFFQNLRRHTSEGMFSDPAYGGNRDMVGWKLAGYPGAQRAYMPYEFQSEGTDRKPQSMAQLHPLNPGEAPEGHDNVILPVSGSDDEKHNHDDDDSNP